MPDRISTFRVARLSIYPPYRDGGNARYAMLVNTVRNGVPRGEILADGVLPDAPAYPNQEDLVALFDSALRTFRLI